MPPDLHVLDCQGFRAGFTGRGGLACLEPAFGSKPVLAPGAVRDPSAFRIIRRPLRQRTGGKTYTARDFALRLVHKRADRLVFEGSSSDGSLAVTQVAQTTGSGSLTWKLRVANLRGAPIWSVAFPVLEGLFWKRNQRITIPLNSGFSLDPRELGEHEELLLGYPVHASMQWLDLYTASHGLYIGIHDEVPYMKQFAVARSGDRVRMEWRYPDPLLRRGEEWWLPEATLVLHRGDWHAGADRYREWADKWITFPEPPAWFARLPAWSWLSGKGNRAPAPQRRFHDLPAAASLLKKETGVPAIQFAGWMEHGHDTHYPDYVPGECMGGSPGLKRAIRDIHRNRGRLALYTNGRLIDPEGSVGAMPNWQRFCVRLAPCARENAGAFLGTFTRKNAWDRDGDLAKEKYGRTLFAVACPHQKDWQNLFIDRLVRLVQSYPVDGLYLDQVCGATCLPCYASDHSHPRPNMAWRGYIELLGNLRHALKRVRKDIYLATEGVCDVFGSFFDAQQSHNDWTAQIGHKGEDMCDLFRYTFPESLDLIGPTSPGKREYLRLGLGVAGGFDCFPAFPHSSGKGFRRFMRNTLGLRRRLTPHIRGARPLATVAASSSRVKVFGLERPDRVVITGGWRGERRTRNWAIRFKPAGGTGFLSAQLWSPQAVSLDWQVEGSSVAFEVPFAEVFAAVFHR